MFVGDKEIYGLCEQAAAEKCDFAIYSDQSFKHHSRFKTWVLVLTGGVDPRSIWSSSIDAWFLSDFLACHGLGLDLGCSTSVTERDEEIEIVYQLPKN